MKKVTMILALVAVLGMAGTTFADANISVSPAVASTLTPGFDIYTLSIVNAEGYLGFITADGVVQANAYTIDYGIPPYTGVEVLTPSAFLPGMHPNNMEIDTHLLFAKASGVFVGAESETNDNAYGDNFGMHRGIGSFDMGGGIGFSPVLAAGTDFMQVVVPTGGLTVVSGMIAGTPDDIAWSVDVGVIPEPSTILMLIAGGLCLLGVRFRK